MSSPEVVDSPVSKRSAVRRAVLNLVLAVIVLDAVAIAAYYLGGVDTAESRTQTIFTVAWMIGTAVVVAVLLRRVRVVRRG